MAETEQEQYILLLDGKEAYRTKTVQKREGREILHYLLTIFSYSVKYRSIENVIHILSEITNVLNEVLSQQTLLAIQKALQNKNITQERILRLYFDLILSCEGMPNLYGFRIAISSTNQGRSKTKAITHTNPEKQTFRETEEQHKRWEYPLKKQHKQ